MAYDLLRKKNPLDASNPDKAEEEAKVALEKFFGENSERVFYSRQVEVLLEGTWFHWVTNRALRDLIKEGTILSEVRDLATGGTVHLMWHRGYRYYKREAEALTRLVEEYSDSNIGAALGLQGEALVLEGFAKSKFLMHGRNTRSHEDRVWTATEHDLDFIFERDGVPYGVEVKNTLGYMEHDELTTKIELSLELGLKPVFAVRMLPKTWINEVVRAGGFALIMKYQMYPWAHGELAKRVRNQIGLPVDTPRALEDGTMKRFVDWHERNL